jgi:hypothetical protein
MHNFIDYNLEVNSVEEADFLIKDAIFNVSKVANNSEIFTEIDKLNEEKIIVKTQLQSIERYRREYDTYKKKLAKSADSLQPIDFLTNKLSDQILESYETKAFIDSLANSLRDIKTKLLKIPTEPLKVTGDADALQETLRNLESRITELNRINENVVREAGKFIALGEVKYLYVQTELTKKSLPLQQLELTALNEEKVYLEKEIQDTGQIRFTMKTLLNECVQRNFNKLTSLRTYKDSRVMFNDQQMVLQIQPKGELFPLDNVGSKSNYMLMHLCFYLGLHEHMISIGQEHVPHFMFIDQPSIPYYSGTDDKGNDDKSKLIDAFSLLNSFIEYINLEKNASFQIFMVEHAPKEYWLDSNLQNFHTVDEFINGNGLIPIEFYIE